MMRIVSVPFFSLRKVDRKKNATAKREPEAFPAAFRLEVL
jgi:hypothetical protein